MDEEPRESGFIWVGNVVWLDFVNTEIFQEGKRVDLLTGFTVFLAWLQEAKILTAAEAKSLAQQWSENSAALQQAREFRSMLRQLANRIAAGEAASEQELDAINQRLRQDKRFQALARTTDGYHLQTQSCWEQTEDLLVPIARSVADLLANGDLALVRKCENPECILYFYDTTKNHARRWCSMSGCGNRHKQATHYRRRRADAAQT